MQDSWIDHHRPLRAREHLQADYIHYLCGRYAPPEVVGKIASAAVNYFVSKGCCLSEASLAFAEIIPREKRQVFPFRREGVPDAGYRDRPLSTPTGQGSTYEPITYIISAAGTLSLRS